MTLIFLSEKRYTTVFRRKWIGVIAIRHDKSVTQIKQMQENVKIFFHMSVQAMNQPDATGIQSSISAGTIRTGHFDFSRICLLLLPSVNPFTVEVPFCPITII